MLVRTMLKCPHKKVGQGINTWGLAVVCIKGQVVVYIMVRVEECLRAQEVAYLEAQEEVFQEVLAVGYHLAQEVAYLVAQMAAFQEGRGEVFLEAKEEDCREAPVVECPMDQLRT